LIVINEAACRTVLLGPDDSAAVSIQGQDVPITRGQKNEITLPTGSQHVRKIHRCTIGNGWQLNFEKLLKLSDGTG
jgi:hypothetical protein